MSRFHTVKVKDVIQETADTVSLSFDIPSDLISDFNFKQGQYITVKFDINGEELRRSYSICSSPVGENELRVAIKKVANGRVSTFLNDNVKAGDSIDIMVPMGNFYSEMNADNKKHYVLFAGGSGITPIFSILKTVLNAEPNSSISLFYANNDQASIIFKEQIEKLEASNTDRFKVYHILNDAPAENNDLFKGLMTIDKCNTLLSKYIEPSTNNEFFVCGPGAMMDNVASALKAANINEEQIHIEYFTASESTLQEATDQDTSEEVAGCNVTFIIDGEENNTILENEETLLEAANRLELDPPYACESGSCCTCKALLEEGEVHMTVNLGLSKKEVKKGYILTCQSKPTTSSVKVNFDKA